MPTLNDNEYLFYQRMMEMFLDGTQAITVQPFTESNSKFGTQYEAAFYTASLAAGADLDIAFEIGANPILIKDTTILFDTDIVSTQWFRGATYTGGGMVNVHNLNEGGAVPEDVTILSEVSTSDSGTAISSLVTSLGTALAGNRTISSTASTIGVERVLSANTDYIRRITNESDESTQVSFLTTWYQGPLSTE